MSANDKHITDPTTVVIWVTHRFAGFHEWPEAPVERAYLASPHRHLFHVCVGLEVRHDDREVEFHDLYDVVVSACDDLRNAGSMSCEMMARRIRDAVMAVWQSRMVTAEVSEDGEFGARVLPTR